MDKVNALCNMDRVMLQAFSQRTIEGLKGYALFRLALPPFQSFLDINVGKEIEKDRGVITQAAIMQQSGTEPGPELITKLLLQAREIDQSFIRNAAMFPIDIKIQYQDIEYYRQQRIELLLHTTYRILNKWQDVSPFRAAMNELYNEVQFRDLLHSILKLYAMETRMLSRSVRIPHLFALLREGVTQTITKVMEQEAEGLARLLARMVYRRNH